MEKDKLAHLKLILDSARKIKEYIGSVGFNDFINDGKTQSAVIMQLHVIGELVKKVPEEIKSKSNLPWKQMIGMRDMISHEYFGLDLEQIWKTSTEDVLELENEIKKFINTQ